ncbi:hypothetical protein BGZ98_004561 [Dissophora globulifera]|nr:hypothetical protein BGZ98_004561 [Dissophora globulifera]
MVSSKLSILSALALLSAATTVQAWTLQNTYQGSNFFDQFDFFTGSDPTHGFVQYVDRATATSKKYVSVQNNQAVIKPDTTSTTTTGRQSVRLVSKTSYNANGLYILDAEHMPVGCGTWPAYWMVGPNWPNSGEIDIIEGVNNQAQNQVTLHTSSGCTMEGVSRWQSASVLTPNCDVNAPGQGANVGCGVLAPNANSYGTGFNNNKGGVYATQWTTSSGIQVWFWPRSQVPGDISSGNPDPRNWGQPLATFPFQSGKCSANKFSNLQFVINLTFCGDWAGSVYASSGCPSSCNAYVGQNPSAFNEAYWRINYLKTYN